MKIYPGERESSKQKALPKKQKTPKPSSWKKALIRFFILACVWSFFILLGTILWFAHDFPNVNQLQTNIRKPSITILASDGSVIGTYGDLYEDMVKAEELPPYVPQALMAVEDRRFYYHFGVDIIGLIRAAYTNYRAKRVVQGGSTLTQQLAKNILFSQGGFSVNDRSIKRKFQEVLLSIWLEWKFTKQQILTMYLNRVYLGAGTFGVEAAARKYFNKKAKRLSVFEAAILAGLLKAPSRYSPAHNPQRAVARAKTVLSLMKEAGFIKNPDVYLTEGIKTLGEAQKSSSPLSKYFSDWVYENLPSLIGNIDKDLIVTTTLDPDYQSAAEASVQDHLEKMGEELKVSESSMIVMTPQGAIKALIGGKSYQKSQFNRATQALRQSGSAFKPFIYLAALEQGMTPETMIADTPVQIGKWTPGNFKWRSRGQVTLKEGLAYSVNSVAVRIGQTVGPFAIARVAQRLGITADLPKNLSITLGSGESTLLELTTAYATFANRGYAVWAYGVEKISDKKGNIIYEHANERGKKLILSQNLSYMNEMMRAVIEWGTGKAANINEEIRGKTGSNGNRDAWFFGYTPQLVVGVWVGNDSNKPMARQSTGGRMPARIAGAFLKNILNREEEKDDLEEKISDAPETQSSEENEDTEINNLDEFLEKQANSEEESDVDQRLD